MIRDNQGRRKYLTAAERTRFLDAAALAPPSVNSFCWTLASTGCRLSEALELTYGQIDYAEKVIVFRCLKKRKLGVFRAVPVQQGLLDLISDGQVSQASHNNDRIWPWCRSTGWGRVKGIMQEAHVLGPHATPKGLRHGFGVAGTQCAIPLGTIQKWLGHSNIQTTAIYTDVVGEEERALAKKLW